MAYRMAQLTVTLKFILTILLFNSTNVKTRMQKVTTTWDHNCEK